MNTLVEVVAIQCHMPIRDTKRFSQSLHGHLLSAALLLSKLCIRL